MRVQILTICDPVPNFGNKLQNYAVQTVLQNWFGARVSTVEFEGNRCTWKSMTRYFLWKYFRMFDSNREYWRVDFPKALAFRKFDNQFLHMTKKLDTKNTDFFVVGSDQVWNPSWYHTNSQKKDMFLLTFAKPEQKVCFAPSFGISELPNEWIPWFKRYLADFPYLNVREDTGALIIKQLIGRDADVVIDPTLMLTKDQWIAIEREPKKVDLHKPYVLTYFLGNLPRKAHEDLERLKKEKGLHVYHIMDKNNSNVYCSSPSEFVYLLHHASVILTDSFHASVFSFIFEKPFLVYAREGAEEKLLSRINNLLSILNLENRLVRGNSTFDIDDIFEIDYSAGKRRLLFEQQKLKRCLMRSFGLEKN